MDEELIEVSRLASAEADLLQWQDRAYEAEQREEELKSDLESKGNEVLDLMDELSDAARREEVLKTELQDAETEIEDKNKDYEELSENYHDLEIENDRIAYERDCYIEVLKGMEFIEIDSYPEKGEEFCRRLGVEAKETIEKVINNALEKR